VLLPSANAIVVIVVVTGSKIDVEKKEIDVG
jgi:hypothetical protein